MDNLQINTWYWFTDPREGDTWYPIYIMSNSEYMLDGMAWSISELKNLTVEKAVMPLINE